MTTTDDEKLELLARARARKAQLAEEEPTESAQRRKDQIRRVKARLRRFILDHGIEIKEAGRVLGYESVFRLPRHLGPGKPDIEDLLAMAEYFEDFDPTTILRDVILGVDEHPDEAKARREKKISPDGERVAAPTPAPEQEPSAPVHEEVVIEQPAPPSPEPELSLDTSEGLKAWADRFGFPA